jgi:peptidyl-prolyl cis-trans isomerase B (cyclophilin B)
MRKRIFTICSVLIGIVFIVSGCGQNNIQNNMPLTPTPQVQQQTVGTQLTAPVKGDTVAVMKTSMGDIKIKLFPKEAPKAVENFTTHAKNGYYNELTFHRIIKDFMIQGGDPNGNGTGGESIWKKPFKDEFSPTLHNFRGALSMANGGPDTNGSQFFIVQNPKVEESYKAYMQQLGYSEELINAYVKNGGTPFLDGYTPWEGATHHTVFGQVYEGMNVVDKIANVKIGENDKPVKDIKILSIEIRKF